MIYETIFSYYLFVQQTIQAWRIIFSISAGIGVFGCIAYCILFNGEEQPWNRTSQARERHESIISTDT